MRTTPFYGCQKCRGRVWTRICFVDTASCPTIFIVCLRRGCVPCMPGSIHASTLAAANKGFRGWIRWPFFNVVARSSVNPVTLSVDCILAALTRSRSRTKGVLGLASAGLLVVGCCPTFRHTVVCVLSRQAPKN